MGSKVCRVCGIKKHYEHFHPNKTCAGGVVGTCRQCTNKKRQKWYDDNRQRRQGYANEKNRSRKLDAVQKFGDKCHDCGMSYPPYVYEFHHLDPSGKDVNPSKAMTYSVEKMWRELDKCVMVCANCHKIRHWGEKEAQDETID